MAPGYVVQSKAVFCFSLQYFFNTDILVRQKNCGEKLATVSLYRIPSLNEKTEKISKIKSLLLS